VTATIVLAILLVFTALPCVYVAGIVCERRRTIDHGYNFQRRQSKISPTLNEFLNSIENREHWK
jgi:hypothetical protein